MALFVKIDNTTYNADHLWQIKAPSKKTHATVATKNLNSGPAFILHKLSPDQYETLISVLTHAGVFIDADNSFGPPLP